MKKKLIQLLMLVLLSVTTSNLFAQALTVKEMEAKLTDNGKQWIWYKDLNVDVTKNEIYKFLPTYKVDVTINGVKKTMDWKLDQVSARQTNIKIGTKKYQLSFTSETGHPEVIILKGIKPTPVVSSYYYSILGR